MGLLDETKQELLAKLEEEKERIGITRGTIWRWVQPGTSDNVGDTSA